MKTVSLFNIAAVVAALTVLAIAFILVPEPLWSAVAIITAIGFAGSAAFVFYIPSILRRNRQDNDARQVVAIGPLTLIGMLLLLSMGGSFVLALAGYRELGLAALVLGIGLFLMAYLILNAALKVVGDVAAQGSQASRHVDWQNRVSLLAAMATHRESLDKLRALGEKLRYSPSDVPGGSPQDTGMEQALDRMAMQLRADPSADLIDQFGMIDSLLAQRDAYLRSARSKA